MNDPDYPPGLFPSVARDVVLLHHRNFHKDAKDDQASQIIMKNIARLLPVHLRGEFA